jgi:hypothetical protein
MPRIIVATEDPHIPDGVGVTLDEDVRAVHLSTGHAASQLAERIAWAVRDAEAQHGMTGRREAVGARQGLAGIAATPRRDVPDPPAGRNL